MKYFHRQGLLCIYKLYNSQDWVYGHVSVRVTAKGHCAEIQLYINSFTTKFIHTLRTELIFVFREEMAAKAYDQYPFVRTGPTPKAYIDITDKLFTHLQGKGIVSRREFTGSAYKGTRVGDSGDYDQLWIKRDLEVKRNPVPGIPGHFRMYRNGMQVDPGKERNVLKGEVQKALNHFGLAERSVVRDHIPAVQLDVYEDPSRNRLIFSVDLVYTLDIGGDNGYLYVPKGGDAWLQTVTPKEVSIMKRIDQGNNHWKLCVKIIKLIRDKEPTLAPLSGYVYETALLEEHGEHPNPAARSKLEVTEIIKKLLTRVASAVEKGVMENYFLKREGQPGVNILPPLGAVTQQNIANRLRNLAKNPERLLPSQEEYRYR